MKKVVIFLLIISYLFACTISFSTENISLNAKSAIVFDRKYKKVLYSKNIHDKLPNASTTKMLTAIVAYENADMDEIVTVSKKAANTGGSRLGLRTGDEVSMGDLIHGLLICSGNDAAVAIAEYIGETEENFCKIMNEKAKEIGAMNTNFVTPHGLDKEEHYSTAYDLAIIADYALDIPYIANIVSKKNSNIKINGNVRNLTTTNEMLSSYSGADGVKTGYTGNAGRCLVTSATRDDWQLICVVLGCDTKKFRTTDSIKLLDYSFDSYDFFDITSILKGEYNISVEKSKNSDYIIKFDEEYILPMTENEISNLRVEYNLKNNFVAPVEVGEKIGDISIFCEDLLLKRFTIINNSQIVRKSPIDYIKMIANSICKYLKI